MAITDVSPMVPWILPKIRFLTGTEEPATKPWSRRAARGVAPVTPSTAPLKLSDTEKSVILPAKEIIRKQRAARAGFIKFWPRPPKSCFTTIIAKILPSTGIQSGIPAGMFRPIRSPVTTALKSFTVFFLCIKWSYNHSASAAEPVDTTRTARAFNPWL